VVAAHNLKVARSNRVPATNIKPFFSTREKGSFVLFDSLPILLYHASLCPILTQCWRKVVTFFEAGNHIWINILGLWFCWQHCCFLFIPNIWDSALMPWRGINEGKFCAPVFSFNWKIGFLGCYLILYNFCYFFLW